MNNKIDNRFGFSIYLLISICFLIFIIAYLIFIFHCFKSNKSLLLIGPIVVILYQLFDYIVNPAYFEATITNGLIVIKTFRPYKRRFNIRDALMINYNKHLTEVIIDRQSYNNYKILIDRLGFRKNLILQKIDNGKIYESKPISVAFLGAKKYTNLILSLDRLTEKITLN